MVDGVFKHGFLMYGVPIGSDKYCAFKLNEIAVTVARWLDSKLWQVLESATDLHIPQHHEGKEWDCVLPVPVVG